jgi:hypothetical protein
VVANKDENATEAFTVVYDTTTGTLKRLSWAAPWSDTERSAAQADTTDAGLDTGGDTTGREVLNRVRAVSVTCRLLHQLGVPQADGPWTVVSVHRSGTWTGPGPESNTAWLVSLSSRRWLVKTCLNGASTQPRQITLDPVEPLTLEPALGSPLPARRTPE